MSRAHIKPRSYNRFVRSSVVATISAGDFLATHRAFIGIHLALPHSLQSKGGEPPMEKHQEQQKRRDKSQQTPNQRPGSPNQKPGSQRDRDSSDQEQN